MKGRDQDIVAPQHIHPAVPIGCISASKRVFALESFDKRLFWTSVGFYVVFLSSSAPRHQPRHDLALLMTPSQFCLDSRRSGVCE